MKKRMPPQNRFLVKGASLFGLLVLGVISSLLLHADPAPDSISNLDADHSAAYEKAMKRGKELTQLLDGYMETLKSRNDPATYETIENFKGQNIIIRGDLAERHNPAIIQLHRSNVNYVTYLDDHLLRWPGGAVQIVCLARISSIDAAKGIVNLETIDARIDKAD